MDPSEPADAPSLTRARLIKRLLWIGTIWLMGWLGMIVTEAISWSNPFRGAMNGAFTGVFLSPFLLILLLPLGLVGWFIGAWRPLRRWQWALSLIFPFLLSFSAVPSVIRDRLDPDRRFTRLTAVAFPEQAKFTHISYSGGLFADLTYIYEFSCPLEETERLIRELKLKGSEGTGGSLRKGTGAGTWKVEEVWTGSDVGNADFVELQLNATRTKVRLICCTI